MSVDTISAVIPQETEDLVIQDIRSVRQNLPFLVDLTDEDRIRIPKLSLRRVGFVDTCLIEAKNHQHYLPAYISIQEFESDVNLKNSLRRILAELNMLTERIKDTLMVVESEAYTAGRVFYKSVKAAAKEGAEDAERIAKELAYHYKRRSDDDENTDNNTE